MHGAAALSLPASLARPALGGTWPGAARSADTRLLRIVRRTIEVDRRAASVFGLVQADGTPGLSLPAGGLFDVVLRDETSEPTLIHWHGLTPPWDQDGVPGAPLPLVGPRDDRHYRFPIGPAGTHYIRQ